MRVKSQSCLKVLIRTSYKCNFTSKYRRIISLWYIRFVQIFTEILAYNNRINCCFTKWQYKICFINCNAIKSIVYPIVWWKNNLKEKVFLLLNSQIFSRQRSVKILTTLVTYFNPGPTLHQTNSSWMSGTFFQKRKKINWFTPSYYHTFL